MTNRQDVELRIRATDTSKQTFAGTVQSIEGVTKALAQQVEAAKRGDESIEDLKQSLTDLKQAGTELIREQSLIDLFNKQADAVGAASLKAQEAAAKYNEMAAAQAKVEEPTKRSVAALTAQESRMQKSQATLERLQATLATTGAKLSEAGIGFMQLGEAQEKLATSATEVGSALAVATDAVRGHGAALQAARAAQAEAAEADKKRVASLEEVARAEREAAAAAQRSAEIEKQQRNAGSVDTLTRELERQEAAEREAAEATAVKAAADEKANIAAREYAEAETKSAAEHEAAFQRINRLQKEAEVSNMWTTLLRDSDLAAEAAKRSAAEQEAAMKRLDAFKSGANSVTMQKNGFSTFSAPTQTGTNADSLRAITDPAAAARDSIDGLEKQVAHLSATLGTAKGPVQGYGESVRMLQEAMKSIVGTGEAIDAFQRQVEAVRAARAQFVSARTDVMRFAEAIKAADAPDEALTNGLKRAQSAVASAGREMRSQVETAREMQAGLEKAGISTNNLTNEEQRLASMARTATATLNTLNMAYRENGSAADAGTAKVKLFGEGHRESLGWMQRVRGELIALATAYVGIQGAIGLASGAIEAFVSKQATENRLGIVVGAPDTAKIGAEYDYVHQQANRLGIGINELADSYSRFALAGKNANLSLDQTKFAFERITEVMRVNHASTDAVNGAFNQLEQMLSKNKVQMDDLRQASNWIPGLEGMLARGLGMVSVKQLFDAMKKGSVDAKTAILSLGEEMERQYGKQIPDALKSLQAEQGRFNTGLYDFKLLIATSGFADAYTTLLQRLAAFFKSADGQQFAKDLSDAFSTLTKAAMVLVDNIGLVKTVVEALLIVKATAWAIGLTEAIMANIEADIAATAAKEAYTKATLEAAAANGALAASAGEAGAATAAGSAVSVTALGLVARALGIVGAALVGIQIGNYLYNQVPAVRKTAIEIVEYFDYATSVIGLGFSSLGDKIVAIWKSLPARIGNSVKELAAMAVEAADAGGPLGAATAAKIRGTKTALPGDPGATDPNAAKYAELSAKFQARLAMIDKHGGYTTDGRPMTPAEQKDADAAAKAADPRGYQAQADLADTLISKEKALNDIISERAKKTQDIIDKRKTGEITEAQAEKQAEALRLSYKPKLQQFAADSMKTLQPMIDAAGFKAPMDKVQDFRSRLSAATGAYEPNLTEDDKKKKGDPIGTMDRSLQNDLSAMLARVDRSAIGTFQDRLEASGRAIEEQYSAIFRKIDQYQKIGGKTVGGESLTTIKAQLQANEDQLKAAAALKLETAEIAKNEAAATNVVKQRTDAYKDIENRVKSGETSPADGMQEATDASVKFNKELDISITKAIAFNNEMRGKPGIDNSKIDASNSKLERQRREGKTDGGSALMAVGQNLDASAEGDVNKILKERNDLTQSYANLVKLGLMTQTDAQKTLQGDYASTHDALVANIDAYQALIDKQKAAGSISPINYDLATAKIKEMRSQVEYLNPDLVKLKTAFEQGFTTSFTNAFDKTAESIANLIDGTHSLSDTWKDLKNVVLDFFGSFLKSIANAIVQIEALKIAQSLMGTDSSGGSGGSTGLFGTLASVFASSAAVQHGGGDVGSSNGMRRMVNPAVFLNAPRYHEGTNGPLGLKADEHATILQTGERVMTKAQTDAARRQATAGSSGGVAVKQVLAIGDDDIAGAMAGSAGEDVTITHIRRNKETIKQMLK